MLMFTLLRTSPALGDMHVSKVKHTCGLGDDARTVAYMNRCVIYGPTTDLSMHSLYTDCVTHM